MQTLTQEQIDNRFRWAKVLKSGDYRQCKSTLRRRTVPEMSPEGEVKESHCCLGVAQDIFDPEGWVRRKGIEGGRPTEYRGGSDVSVKVLTALGLTRHEIMRYSDRNDRGASFPTIADYVTLSARRGVALDREGEDVDGTISG
jgi:hypothetical protein